MMRTKKDSVERAVVDELKFYVKDWIYDRDYITLTRNLVSLVKAARSEGRRLKRRAPHPQTET